ncbi:hypothetical protein [Streptomyces cucumeris]|uniref:hypothetical protein n=1 Tax=Streptomyces cucumeris TaxID=2962890 RepID=UPI003D7125A0
MRLWTVQPRAALTTLRADGELTGAWERVDPAWRPAYEAMVARMESRGVSCAGRPPFWAWAVPDTADDRVAWTAVLLLGLDADDPGPFAGYRVLDLEIADELVVLSSYPRWNTFLDDVLMGEESAAMDWSIDADEFHDPDQMGVQACVPRLRADWVLGCRPLTTPPGD